MYQVRFYVLTLLILSLTSCSKNIITVPDTTLKNLKADWLIPTKQSCEKNEGFFDAVENVCEATLSNGEKICLENSGHLPSIDEYLELSKLCGALEVRRDDEFESSRNPNYDSKPNKRINADNESYQACFEALGFYTIGEYLSSSIADSFEAETICHNGICTRYTHTIKDQNRYEVFRFYYAEVNEKERGKNGFIACKR